jgi:hypothetical protein
MMHHAARICGGKFYLVLASRWRTFVKKLVMAATAAMGLSYVAHAGVIPTLDTITLVGNEYEFSYSGTLAGDTGLVDGDRLVIFDFRGYVDGSISAGIYASDIDAYTEFTSPLASPPGYDDDPSVVNLVFEWIGAPFDTSGGPFVDVSFAGLTARSIGADVRLDGYASMTTINNGAATGLRSFDRGPVAVPIPEPSTGVPLVVGFGLASVKWCKSRVNTGRAEVRGDRWRAERDSNPRPPGSKGDS